ncbi:MAG: Ig-like domain-containing protein, partial [Oscillospiraceae bacterium]|nr:Ig-like domain-containing protein [Oscillospiraceae bacterium]
MISEIDTAAGNNDNNVEETYIPEAETEDIPEVIPVVYQVMFDLRGHGDAVEAVAVEENGRVTQPADPTADGYTFEGWYTDDVYENRWDFDSMPVVHDTVLYARWTEEVSDPEIDAGTDAETEDVSSGADSADDEEMQESAESIESAREEYSEEENTAAEEEPEEKNTESEEELIEAKENTEEENNESEKDSDHNSETENINELKEVSQTEASTDEKRDANAEEVIALKDTASSDAAEIAVCATEGAFPEGAALSVGEVSAEKQADVDAAVEELREEGRRVAASYTFEIKVLDEDGTTELEPADDSTVRVFFAFPEAADPNLTASVYHVSTDEATGGLSAEALDILPVEEVSIPEELDTVDQETVVAVETEGFSYYTVEFTYDEMQYVLEGDASIPLNDILSAVGLSGDVEAVEVSDETLFSATQENGTWMITALRAFSTEEWMKVTIGGVTYEITVTDDGPAQAKKTIVTGTTYTFHDQVFTDKGTLVASPASAAAGETVTLRLEADEYYGIKENSFTVHDGSGQGISLAFAAQDDGSYTFVMPDDADNDTYTITAEIEWTNAPMSGNVTTQNIVIASNIEHGTVFAKYLQYAGSTLYERINSATDAGAMKTVYDTPRPIWLYAEPEEGYELAAWKVEAVYLDELDNMDAETDGSLPVERIDDADESGDALVYPWLFELGKYYRNSNKYICFRISADFREIQEPVLEPHSITVNYRDVTSDGEATGCSASVWVQDGDNLVAVTQATKGDTVTVRVKLTNGASLSTGESGSELSIYSSTASGVEYIEYQETEQAEADEDDPNASIRTFTFVMPDRDVNILALFDFVRFTVTPAPLPDGSYIHYALFRNGTDLNHQVGAGYFDANSETWVKTEGEAEWQARPGDTLVIQLRTADLLNKNTVPGTLTLKDAGTGDPIGEPLFLKVYNESGTEYRAETSMPACDISFSVEMVNCYTVTMEDSEFGVFGVFPKKAREGETVVINAVPDDPLYDIAWSATWTDKNGELQPIEITKDPENKLRASFIMPAADVRVTGEFSQWKALQNKIDEAADGSTIRLEANYTAGGSDVSLVVDGKDVTIDLNGYAIDRNLTQAKSNVGHVFHLKNDAKLTITDSSAGSGDASEDGATGAGFIKGGYANNGGGFYIDGGSTLNIEGGHIAGNRVTGSGAGIYVNNGALNMTGGCVTTNSAEGSGGGIYVNESGTLSLDSVIISDNYVGSHGGGLFLRLAENARITNCTISNNASGKYGGGLRMDAKDRTLTISGTTISGNRSFDDGGGIHLNNGFIAMDSGSVISDNISYYDGGGMHVAGNAHFTAMDVTISGNKAYREEGGGIKNNGTVQLIDCTVRDNEAAKQGGGLFNDNDGNSAGTMTLKDCTVTGNKSDSDGGGVYSDRKLTVIGGETWGNTATHGGGMFIGGGSEATDIQKDPVIQDNEAATSGHNLYLKSGRKLALIGPLTEGSSICLDLESGTGVLTENYRVHNGTDAPETFFTLAKGYDTRFTEEGEVEICSEWSALKKQVESAAGGTVITLEKDYAASASDDRITVSKDITIDLNGHALNRNRLSNTDDGHVLEVFSGGTLTLLDSSPDKTGVITGGWSNTGGGIYVNENGTLNLRGVRIAGNHAGTGGGVYLKGTLNITDGRIEGNIADRSGGIRTESGATVTLQGSPVVWGNTAASNGTDSYLHSKGTIGIAGPLTDGTKIGVALESDWGVFTSGYGNQNGDDTPGAYFVSTEGYGIYLENGEALIGPTTFGGTEYEDPFVSGSDQINDDVDGLGGKNWMSGLSGERLLNEINMPGSHDSGMNNVQNIKTSQGITWAVAGIAAAAFVSAVVPGMQTVAASLALTAVGLSFGLPSDYTSGLSWFMEDAAAPKAKTQKEYIGEQLADGCRQLDLRLYYQHKVYKWYYGGYVYDDDGENLWVCHGKKGGGRYMAQDADGDDLSFSMVLDTVKEFLRLHPTETVILDLRPETENEKEQEKIYPRARTILEAVALDINPSTGEPYLYKDPESDDYFASYESMPKLADCRGKIVLMPDNNDFTEKVGGFVRGDLMSGGEVLAELDYQNTKEMMVQQMEMEYSKANHRSNPVTLPSDASERLRKLWYWELNCTGQHAEYGQYYYDMDAPHKLAEYVNSHLIGDGGILNENITGQYIGWVRMDSFNGKYAEEIWKTNFFDTLDYCTVTVKSGLEDESHYPDQSYLILSGTKLTVPENIYKKLDDGWYFAFWESETGKRYNPGDKLEVTGDIILTARWLGDGEIPVRATWKDADDKDGLRPDNLNLAVSVAGKPLSVTLTADGGWMGTIHALVGMKDQIVITPEWSRIDMSGGNYGTDTEGQYRFELSYEIGTGYTLTLIHTPRGSVLAAGEVKWEDSDNAAGKRPETVTVRLYKNGEPTGGIAEVSAEYGWQYTFGERTQYENGEENFYTVVQNEIENYVTKIDGFTIVNKYSPEAQGTVNVEGLVQWDDAGNAKGLRPEKILVHLKADGKETDSQEVESSGLELWYLTFDNVLLTDETGRITYTVDPQQVEGYTVTCERIGLVEADSQDGSDGGAQGDASDAGAEEEEDVESYTFLITYTLEVTDEEKTDAAVTRVPVARELSYSATAQELIEEGEAEGGRLMYALGDSADTPPDASDFTAELPVGTDAGTYHVWYYVRADVMHRNTAPQQLTVTIGKAAPTIEAADLRLTDGDVGRTVEAAVTGVEGETEGPGALHYEVTEGDAVTVDASTGVLTVHSTGIAELTLSVPETTNYTAATATVTVTVVHQHALTEIAEKAATCEEDGNITYWLCAQGDGRCFSDAEGIHEITKEETVIPALGHDWGEWTVTKEATETEEGEETRVCQNDPTHVETRVIPMLTHVHGLTYVEAKAAICTEDGNIAYWVCSQGENPCGRYFSDAEGIHEIAKEETVIPALGHDWGEWEVTQKATAAEPGVKTRTCKHDPSHTETETIPQLTFTVPAAVTGLVYDKEEKALVTAGTAEGALLQYALGADATTAPAEGWGDSAPTAVDAGTYHVWYMVAGDSEHEGIAPDCIEVTISQAAAEIRYENAIVSKRYNESPFIYTPTNTGNGTVTYSSSDESVATVDSATGGVTIVGAGEAVITARTEGSRNYHYDPAEASYTLTVSPRLESISFERDAVEKTWGDAAFTNPLTNSGDAAVKYTSSDEYVATVDEASGLVTLVGAGTATVTATVADSAASAYEAPAVSYQLTVKEAENPGFVSGSATVTRGGNTLNLNTLVRNAQGPVSYAISGESLGCTVDADGVFTSGNTPGTVTVTVTFAGDNRYGEKTAELTVNVADKTTRRLSGSATRIYGDPLNLPIYIVEHIPEDAVPDTRYTGTMRSGVAYDSPLPPTQTGEYILTQNYEDSEEIWIETITFKIMPRQLGIPEITLGDALTYNGSEQTQTVASVLWGEDLVPAGEYTVANNRGTDAGVYTLTVTATPTGNYTGSATKEFTISQAKGEISYPAAPVSKIYGDEAFTNALMNTGDGTVSYSSSDESVATVNPASGKVTITGAGEARITATAADGKNYRYDSMTASYVLQVAKKPAAISYAEQIVTKSYGDGAFTNDLMNTGDATVTYSIEYPSVAAVNPATGEVTILDVGSATVTAMAGESANYQYNPSVASYVLRVGKKSASIGFEPDTVEKTWGDEAFTLTLTNSGDGTVNYYSSSNTDVATVDSATGEVTIKAAGTATITATVTDGATSTYAVKSASCQLTVKKAANPALIASSANVQTGETVDLKSKIKGPVGGLSFAIDGDANGCTVNPNTGAFTAGNTLGDVTVTVTVAGDQNHESKSGSITVHVVGQSVDSPELWPARITYGEEKLDEVVKKHIWEDATPSIHYTGTTRSGEPYNSDIAPKDAGEYLVTVSYEYSEGIYEGLCVATIQPKSLEEATVELGEALTYTGSEQTQQVASVTWKFTVMTPNGPVTQTVEVLNSEYTIRNNQKTDAGTYLLTVTANPNGNYTESATKEFTIAKAKGKLSYAEETVSKTWGDDAFTNKLTNTGDLRVTYDSDNEAVAEVHPTTGEVTIKAAGTATIKATAVAAENENYYFEPGTAASYTLKVAKAASTVSVPPAPVQDLEYNGGQQALVSAGETPNGTMQYALGTDASTPPADSAFSKDIPTGKDAGTYYVWYKVVGDDNHSDNKVLSPVTVTVRKRETTLVWSNTTPTYDGNPKAPTATVYNLIDGDSCDVTVEGAQTNTGTYTAKATALSNPNYKLPDNATADFTIQKAEGTIRFAEANVEKTWGDESFTIKPTIEGDGTVTYESSNPNVATVDADGKVTIIGAGEATITATAVEGTNTSYNLSPTASYTLTVAPAEAEVYKAPATVMGLGYNGAPQRLVTAGEAIGGTMQYVIAEDGKTPPADDAPWSTSLPASTNAGIYYVWYRVVGDDNHNSTAPVSVTGYIATAASRGSVEANTLYYTGTAQDLVEPVEAEGGELMYALGTDAVTPPDLTSDVWSNQIPQGTDVDTYYVWYYVKGGDDNYSDTAPAVREVTIQPKAVSYDVTFTVSHGSWNDGSTADVVVKLEGYETQDSSPLKLSRADIPAVGNNPERYYDAGSWDVTPDTEMEITQNTTYTYTYQKIVYTLTEGAGQTHTKGSGGSLAFTIKRFEDDATTYSHFTAVADGTAVLTRDQDYTAASGSLVLTLQPAFLETLEPGTHSVNVAFDDAADPVLV